MILLKASKDDLKLM